MIKNNQNNHPNDHFNQNQSSLDIFVQNKQDHKVNLIMEFEMDFWAAHFGWGKLWHQWNVRRAQTIGEPMSSVKVSHPAPMTCGILPHLGRETVEILPKIRENECVSANQAYAVEE